MLARCSASRKPLACSSEDSLGVRSCSAWVRPVCWRHALTHRSMSAASSEAKVCIIGTGAAAWAPLGRGDLLLLPFDGCLEELLLLLRVPAGTPVPMPPSASEALVPNSVPPRSLRPGATTRHAWLTAASSAGHTCAPSSGSVTTGSNELIAAYT